MAASTADRPHASFPAQSLRLCNPTAAKAYIIPIARVIRSPPKAPSTQHTQQSTDAKNRLACALRAFLTIPGMFGSIIAKHSLLEPSFVSKNQYDLDPPSNVVPFVKLVLPYLMSSSLRDFVAIRGNLDFEL